MADDNSSGKWVAYIGVATEDKEIGSRTIKAYCSELLPYAEGDLNTEKKPIDYQLETPNGEKIVGKIKASNYVTAEYFDLFSNRNSPPDIVKGEQIFLFNYDNSDKYMWFSIGRDDKLRKTEEVTIGIAAKSSTDGELNDDNQYLIRFDSRNKKLLLKTSKANGETYTYQLEMDAANNTFTIKDDDDNFFLLNSNEPRLFLKNKNGTFLDLDKDDFFGNAVRDMKLSAGRQLVIDTPIMTTANTSGDGVTVLNVNGMTVNATKAFIVNGECIGFNGAVVIPESLVVGNMQAESYSVGSSGGPYNSPTSDTDSGTADNAPNTPNPGGGSTNNRHVAAFEDVNRAFHRVADVLDRIKEHILFEDEETDTIRQNADSSIMHKNRGE